MGKIDKYIESIYKDFDKSDEEVKVLKEEMKAHLYDKVEELKLQGHSEEESVKIAIESFGEENKVSNELENIISKQNWLLKVLRIAAVVLFIIACGLKGGSLYYEGLNQNEIRSTLANTPDGIIQYEIREKIQNKDTLTDRDKEQIISVLDKFNNDNHNAIYYIKIEKKDKVFLEYKKEVSKDAIINESGGWGLAGNKGWSVSHKVTDFGKIIDEHAWESIMSRSQASDVPENRLNKYSLMVFIAFWTIMAVYFLQKNLLRKQPSRLYMILLMAESCLVFTALTFDDHKDFMMLFVITFTAANIIYEWIYKRRVKSS